MKTPVPFEPFLLFGFMAFMLVLGMILRARIKVFQQFLIPSCFIGGLIGLVLISTGLVKASTSLLETYAYHLFNISFISLGLTTAEKEGDRVTEKNPVKGPAWMALVSGVTMSMQGIVGGFFILFFNAVGFNLFPTFGFLAPLGFTQGPGQALSIGKVWEGFGFHHAATIGLTFASIGFAFAFFVGVPLVNWGIRKGLATKAPKSLSKDILQGVMGKESEKESAGVLTVHSGNADTLAFHTALIGIVYVITYLLVEGMELFVPADVAKSLWAFFFFFGILVALPIRILIVKAGFGHMLSPGVQRRITGWSVDFLIISTIMAIQAVIVWKYIVPIFSIAMVSGLLTILLVVFLGRRIWSYNLERTIGIYGLTTGNASSGLLLLRIADPEFRTPAALELGIQAVFASPIVLSYMILIHAPIWWDWSVELVIAIFAGAFILSFILLKIFRFLGPRKF